MFLMRKTIRSGRYVEIETKEKKVLLKRHMTFEPNLVLARLKKKVAVRFLTLSGFYLKTLRNKTT